MKLYNANHTINSEIARKRDLAGAKEAGVKARSGKCRTSYEVWHNTAGANRAAAVRASRAALAARAAARFFEAVELSLWDEEVPAAL